MEVVKFLCTTPSWRVYIFNVYSPFLIIVWFVSSQVLMFEISSWLVSHLSGLLGRCFLAYANLPFHTCHHNPNLLLNNFHIRKSNTLLFEAIAIWMHMMATTTGLTRDTVHYLPDTLPSKLPFQSWTEFHVFVSYS